MKQSFDKFSSVPLYIKEQTIDIASLENIFKVYLHVDSVEERVKDDIVCI